MTSRNGSTDGSADGDGEDAGVTLARLRPHGPLKRVWRLTPELFRRTRVTMVTWVWLLPRLLPSDQALAEMPGDDEPAGAVLGTERQATSV